MTIKDYLKQNFFINVWLKKKRITGWIKGGYSTIPAPHDIKQLNILHYAVANKLDVLVETGTYLGDMVWAMKDYFKKIYSIELSEELYKRAAKRFSNHKHIEIIQGDSSEKIGRILSEIKSPVLFWLDGHYSGGITAKGDKICPIYAELTHIFKSPFSHVILIDDARLFIGKEDYPSQEELKAFVTVNSSYQMKIEIDTIVLSK